MKLYVCWGTFWTARPGGHPCRNAHQALRDAGHDPEVERTYGLGLGPDALTAVTAATPGRRKVEELSGQRVVPVLELDNGSVIAGSERIVEWARSNPAP